MVPEIGSRPMTLTELSSWKMDGWTVIPNGVENHFAVKPEWNVSEQSEMGGVLDLLQPIYIPECIARHAKFHCVVDSHTEMDLNVHTPWPTQKPQ